MEPVAARTCRRLRRLSAILYGLALGSFTFGAVFAFVLPILLAADSPANTLFQQI